MSKIVLIANGNYLMPELVYKFRHLGYTKIACADGGANFARRNDIMPDYIIGDLDSIANENLEYFKDRTKIIRYSRQNDSDVEKALKYLKKNGYSDVVILAGTGDRLDHTIGMLSIVLKFSNELTITLVHEKNYLRVISGEYEFYSSKGEIISLYGFDAKTLITTFGLKYKLKNEALQFGCREGTSNVATGSKVKLEVNGGKIFVIRELKAIFND